MHIIDELSEGIEEAAARLGHMNPKRIDSDSLRTGLQEIHTALWKLHDSVELPEDQKIRKGLK